MAFPFHGIPSAWPLPTPADASPATPDMPFQALVDCFVDLDSTFADARKMSQPQIALESVDHLTYLPAPSPSPFKLSVLLDFLSARIDPTLTELRSHDLSAPPFLTLIVGSPAHPLAGKSLHSHLVGCFTNNDTRFHFTLYVPVGRHSSRPWPQCAFTLPSHFWYARRTILSVLSLPWMTSLLVFPGLLPSILFPPPLAWFVQTFFFPPATNFTGQPVEGRTDFVSLTPAPILSP